MSGNGKMKKKLRNNEKGTKRRFPDVKRGFALIGLNGGNGFCQLRRRVRTTHTAQKFRRTHVIRLSNQPRDTARDEKAPRAIDAASPVIAHRLHSPLAVRD